MEDDIGRDQISSPIRKKVSIYRPHPQNFHTETSFQQIGLIA